MISQRRGTLSLIAFWELTLKNSQSLLFYNNTKVKNQRRRKKFKWKNGCKVLILSLTLLRKSGRCIWISIGVLLVFDHFGKCIVNVNNKKKYVQNELLCNFIEITLQHGRSPVNLLHIFRISFRRNTSEWLFLKYSKKQSKLPLL